MVYVYKKDDRETTENMIKRFTRRMQQSGVLMHVRRNRFDQPQKNKAARRQEALYKNRMRKEVDKLKKPEEKVKVLYLSTRGIYRDDYSTVGKNTSGHLGMVMAGSINIYGESMK